MTPLNLIGYIGPRYSGISVTTCAVPTQTVSADRSRWTPGVDAGLPGFFDHNGEAQPAVSVLPSERHGIDPDRVRRRIRDALAAWRELTPPVRFRKIVATPTSGLLKASGPRPLLYFPVRVSRRHRGGLSEAARDRHIRLRAQE